jgi:hypothetical protein
MSAAEHPALAALLGELANTDTSLLVDGCGEPHSIVHFIEEWAAAGYPGVPQGTPIPDGFDDLCMIEVLPNWRAGRGRFWGPNRNGYTNDPKQAGLYTGDEARAIVAKGSRARAVLPEGV